MSVGLVGALFFGQAEPRGEPKTVATPGPVAEAFRKNVKVEVAGEFLRRRLNRARFQNEFQAQSRAVAVGYIARVLHRNSTGEPDTLSP